MKGQSVSSNLTAANVWQEAGRGGLALSGGCAKDQRAAPCLAPRAQTPRQATVIAVLISKYRALPCPLCLNPLSPKPLSQPVPWNTRRIQRLAAHALRDSLDVR